MARDHHYFVYIIECADGFYYTGITNDLERPIAEHNDAINQTSFTFKRRPVVLKYAQHFNYVKAIAWEKQLKGWNRKKKKALLIEDWEEVKRLANIIRGSHASSASD